jgi:uroporphyrin-III C-methyltransferase/precorrin-2 dehydrogenase/sirohydrochlorin ferrochelatase
MKYGRSGMTPVAIIENGTRPNQRVVTGKLHELDAIAKRHNIGSPALIIVGEVVNLHEKLSQGLVDQWQSQQRLAS